MLVGRDSERDVLRERLASAQQRLGGTVLISGEAGIGKSALLADFTGYARAAAATVLTGRAVSGGGAYRPFVEALMPPLRTGQVTESPELRPFRSALGRVLPGWAPPGPPEPGVDPVLLLGEGVLRLLLALAGGVRVLALEDLQLADADSLALLEYLASAVAELPVLLVGVQGDWPPSAPLDRLARTGNVTRLRLERLPRADVVALVDGVRQMPPAVRDVLVDRAEGLPLVAAALAAGLPGEQPTFDEAVPESFASLVEARLAELSVAERRVLEAAAVLGSGYWPLVPQLAELDEHATASGVRRAVQLNLLVAEEGELGWRHGLTREIVWATMLPADRRRLSQRAAELLLHLGTEDAAAAAADRLAEAGDHDGAAGILVQLARSALTGGALRTAEDLLRRAAQGRNQIEVDVLRVELLTATGRVDEALRVGAA
ncbi:MAG TPA: ATP-binding protein, partial [Propionibacteriaceae bacterium]|nr:ATP-binding protein [Propionibacteriaceae bacterium]